MKRNNTYLNIKDLYEQGKSYREIAEELCLSKSLVGKVIGQLKAKGLLEDCPRPQTVDDSKNVDTSPVEKPGDLFDEDKDDNEEF